MNLERVIAVRTNETVYRGGDQCVKVFGDGFTKADALGEALNQARVEECGLHVPKVLEVSQVDGKWGAGHRVCGGENTGTAYRGGAGQERGTA